MLQLAMDKSIEGREQLTTQIAQLSLEREHMLSDQERDLIFDILDKLIHEFEVPIRRRLAERLSRNAAAPWPTTTLPWPSRCCCVRPCCRTKS